MVTQNVSSRRASKFMSVCVCVSAGGQWGHNSEPEYSNIFINNEYTNENEWQKKKCIRWECAHANILIRPFDHFGGQSHTHSHAILVVRIRYPIQYRVLRAICKWKIIDKFQLRQSKHYYYFFVIHIFLRNQTKQTHHLPVACRYSTDA